MMDLQRKALYNLIRINIMPGTQATLFDGKALESWQLENYRNWSNNQLIQKLQELKIGLELADFEAYAKNYDSPEEMADSLSGDLDFRTQDYIYLIIFELWRRLLTEKHSMSIFGDELDHQMILYDRGETKNPADIQDAIAYLQKLLDDHVDEGIDPLEVFAFVQQYCANDIESFIYDYINEEIDANNLGYAYELVDGFYRYISDPLWFDFLKLRIELAQESEDINVTVNRFIKNLTEAKQLQLNLEVIQFFAKRRDRDLFVKMAIQSIPLLTIEEDLEDFLTICQNFFHTVDHLKEEKSIQEMIEKRKSRDMNAQIQNDPDLETVKNYLKQFVIS